MQIYQYVGPRHLLALAEHSPTRQRVLNAEDVKAWFLATRQRLDATGKVTATFIVDTNECLWIADRHCEHVSCAAGRPVLCAGEITFDLRRPFPHIVAITNQSTGYCPQPSSWDGLARVLRKVGLPFPTGFTSEFHFRRCQKCGTTNIIKDDDFTCAVCLAELDAEWNFNNVS
jgi:hypothetical protein